MSVRRLAIPLLTALVLGCGGGEPATLKLATTTSFRDSGLLDELLPLFERQSGLTVDVLAVGSGQALELGRRGDVDVLVTHSPGAEEAFMAAGFGSARHGLMHNDFVLVGPQSDPAGVAREADVATAFRRIAEQQAMFVSRGDESGTHTKEQAIWQAAGRVPSGEWYILSGVGMAAALRLAAESRGYTLADRPTFLAQRQGLDLVIHSQGDALLENPYSVITIDPVRHPHVNAEGGRRFAEFLRSPEARERIAAFGLDRHGEPLFFVREVGASRP